MEVIERIEKVGNLGLDMQSLLDEKERTIENLYFGEILYRCVGVEALNSISAEKMISVLDQIKQRIQISIDRMPENKRKAYYEKLVDICETQRELQKRNPKSILPAETVMIITEKLSILISEEKREEAKQRLSSIPDKLEILMGRTVAFLTETSEDIKEYKKTQC